MTTLVPRASDRERFGRHLLSDADPSRPETDRRSRTAPRRDPPRCRDQVTVRRDLTGPKTDSDILLAASKPFQGGECSGAHRRQKSQQNEVEQANKSFATPAEIRSNALWQCPCDRA